MTAYEAGFDSTNCMVCGVVQWRWWVGFLGGSLEGFRDAWTRKLSGMIVRDRSFSQAQQTPQQTTTAQRTCIQDSPANTVLKRGSIGRWVGAAGQRGGTTQISSPALRSLQYRPNGRHAFHPLLIQRHAGDSEHLEGMCWPGERRVQATMLACTDGKTLQRDKQIYVQPRRTDACEQVRSKG